MKLHQLKRSIGFKDKAKQRGRGNGTGTGNYSGRGLKGQKARSGHSMKAFFEGGQTSIIQRLPKAKGFKRPFKMVKVLTVINLGTLDQDKRISDTMEITKAVLKTLGYIKNEAIAVKILGDGDYSKHLTFTGIVQFSKSAQEKMAAPTSVESRKVPDLIGAGSGHKVMLQSVKEQQKDKKDKKDERDKKIKAAKKAPKAVKPVKVVEKVVAIPLLEVAGQIPSLGGTSKVENVEKKPVKKTIKKTEGEVKKPTVVAGEPVVKKKTVAPKKVGIV